MDLLIYLEKNVYINLSNGFYYRGKVIDADEISITVIDKNGQRVSLKKDIIESIKEIL